jgi:predicted enzyme related to lactoylglutathione lyase
MRSRDIAAGAPCWIDLSTSDTDTARAFYAGVFGWTALEADEQFGGYFMFDGAGGVPVAGCAPAMEGFPTDRWQVYLTVEDAAKTLESAAEHGGRVIVGPMQIGDAGTMGVVADPAGVTIGLWQPGDFGGTVNAGEPGLPSWFELHATDYDAQVAFYRDVFRWTGAEQPGMPFRYNILSHGQDPLAGIMEGGLDHAWDIYIWTDDADATLGRVTELGGSVLRAPEDTPYGRLATLADPTGARIKLMAANDQMPGN